MKGRNFAQKINGKPVVNATRAITLHISPLDIKKGGLKSPGTCAAAQAAMREIPNCTMARIHLGRAYIFDAKKQVWNKFQTTDALRTEVVAFDRGGKFEPGSYKIRPLSPSDAEPKKKARAVTGNSGGGTGPLSSYIQKKPRKLHVVRGVRRRAGAAR